MMDVQRIALEIYSSLRPDQQQRLVWSMSKSTMEALAGRELKDSEMDGEYLIERPVWRDDTVGYGCLKYELAP